MAIDASSLMLALSGLYGNNSYGSSLLTNSTSSAGSFQNILLAALLGGSSALAGGVCPYCAALYGQSGALDEWYASDAENEEDEEQADLDEFNKTASSQTEYKTVGDATATGRELNEYFEEAEEEYGVSADLLRAVAKVESAYNLNAKGESGARGLMQLMPAMAERMEIKDIYDARENIMGAAHSLARKLEFNGGDVAQAVRSYHAGNVASALYKGEDVEMGLDQYVEKVLQYAGEDLTDEVASSQSGKSAKASAASSEDSERVFSAEDAEYLAEMAKMQMQMSGLSALNTSLSGSGDSGSLI